MNIVLIGMSGAGKSTLGVLLAKEMGMDFVDTDIVIQQNEGKLLQDIIDNYGLGYFSEIEEKIVSNLELKDSIISTGGSVIYSDKAMNVLRKDGKIIYLHVTYDEIQKRLTNLSTRGIVMKKGKDLKDVYEERNSLYMKYSDATLNCTKKDIVHCVRQIIEIIQEKQWLK